MLDSLANHSRVWVFQSNRIIDSVESDFIRMEMTNFMKDWASHGNELYGDFSIEDNYFLIVGADEQRSPTSGCSIDTLTRKVKELGKKNNIDFFNRLNIAVQNKDQKIELLNMMEFKNRAKRDEITSQTIVYNNLIETKAELAEKWIAKVADSWHKNLLDTF